MQLDFLENLLNIPTLDDRVSQEGVMIGPTKLPLDIIRNKRAKKYIIRLLPELVLRVTIPRGGSKREALRFVSENIRWIEKQFHSQRLHDALVPKEGLSNLIYYQGRAVPIEPTPNDPESVIFAGVHVPKQSLLEENTSCVVEQYLKNLAKEVLPSATKRLAKRHGFQPKRISIRNQKTRWGSCSNSGTISLNWRLIQLPLFVREYVILHELTHLEYLDHSPRFWSRLAKLCPNHKAAESWLKKYSLRLK